MNNDLKIKYITLVGKQQQDPNYLPYEMSQGKNK